MYLKREPPNSLPRPLLPIKASFDHESGPQGLRRPRFSFFRFNFQTARKPGGLPFRRSESLLIALEAQGLRSTSEAAFTMDSEMLLRRAFAPR